MCKEYNSLCMQSNEIERPSEPLLVNALMWLPIFQLLLWVGMVLTQN